MKKFFAALMFVSLFGFGSAQAETLTFGTNTEFHPFEFISANGVIEQFDGIDMALAKRIAEDNGMTAKIEDLEFDSLIMALDLGRIDAIIAGMTVTEERKEFVNFSDTYFTAKQVMVVRKKSPIRKASDMKGKKIAVLQGFTGETCVKKMGYTYEAFKKGSDAILALKNKKCDVVVLDKAAAEKFVADVRGLEMREDDNVFGVEEYALAVKKDNPDLLNKINASLAKMKKDGSLRKIIRQYVGK